MYKLSSKEKAEIKKNKIITSHNARMIFSEISKIPKDESPRHSICTQLRLQGGLDGHKMGVLGILWECWRRHSGDWLFPIPTPSYDSPESGYRDHKARVWLWGGDQGELRHELVEFTIAGCNYAIENNN